MNLCHLKLLACVLVCSTALHASPSALTAQPANASVHENEAARLLAESVLQKMSLEERVGLLAGASTMHIAGQAKHGIPDFWFSDGPHGVRADLSPNSFAHAGRNDDHSTSLPSLSALAATWDAEYAFAYGELLGREARERGKDMLLGPGVNLARTPLNGRNWEYLGEDPVLSARLAVPYIRGVQSQSVAACIKHYAANDQELNRNGVDARMDERTFHEVYLVPFEAAVKEAEVLGVMNGYNRFRGLYCSHSDYLNNQILKKELGFQGLVVSDWGGVHDTVQAALGGLDVEMNAGRAIKYFRQPLLDAVRSGAVPEQVVEDKARRVLYVMAKTGLLGKKSRPEGSRNTVAHQAFAREVAERSIVLLKNDAKVLPLPKQGLGRLLVIGANADTKHCHEGYSAEGKPPYEITPLQGLRQLLGSSVQIDYVPGPFADIYSQIPDSLLVNIDSNNLTQGVAVKGWNVIFSPTPTAEHTSQHASFHRYLDFDWRNKAPLEKVEPGAFRAQWTTELLANESGEYAVSLKHDGKVRLFLDGALALDAWQPGQLRESRCLLKLSKGTKYRLSMDYEPAKGQGQFAFGWRPPSLAPVSAEQLLSKATSADQILFFTGNRHGHGQARECEGGDRPNLSLAPGDDEAIAAVLAAHPRSVVINLSGSPVAMPWEKQAKTLVQYWFSGQEGGMALARLLLGESNFSGKLPMTFPRQLKDSPPHALDDYKADIVHYREGLLIGHRWFDAKNIEPLFAFGHGLSYTSFAYDKLKVRRTGPASVELSLTITNTGDKAGDEIVQCYVEPLQPKLPRPVRELKAFVRTGPLAPGQSKEVHLTLTPRAFSSYIEGGAAWQVQAGEYLLHAAASSRELRLLTRVHIDEAPVAAQSAGLGL